MRRHPPHRPGEAIHPEAGQPFQVEAVAPGPVPMRQPVLVAGQSGQPHVDAAVDGGELPGGVPRPEVVAPAPKHGIDELSLSLGYTMSTSSSSWRPSCWTHPGIAGGISGCREAGAVPRAQDRTEPRLPDGVAPIRGARLCTSSPVKTKYTRASILRGSVPNPRSAPRRAGGRVSRRSHCAGCIHCVSGAPRSGKRLSRGAGVLGTVPCPTEAQDRVWVTVLWIDWARVLSCCGAPRQRARRLGWLGRSSHVEPAEQLGESAQPRPVPCKPDSELLGAYPAELPFLIARHFDGSVFELLLHLGEKIEISLADRSIRQLSELHVPVGIHGFEVSSALEVVVETLQEVPSDGPIFWLYGIRHSCCRLLMMPSSKS